MRNRFLIICCLLTLSIGLIAQTQQGYVKTLGRPNQQGRALGGVSIRVKGGHNAVLSGQDGRFEMPMPGKKAGESYALQQVQKSGYELKDKGVVGRSYAYSDKVPLTLVMLSRSDYQQDKQQIENHIYAAVEKRYKSDLSRLEQQLSSHQIATEQYRQQLQQLQDGFGKIQELVEGLADHYALVDYDELDEREREITLAIERGNLEQADQLLQQMNIQQRAQDIADRLKKGQALRDEAQQDLVEVLKRQEKDAEYLYQLYTIALARFDNDKARFYIETRAELDSTNVEWQLEAGQFIVLYVADYNKALTYSQSALRQSILQYDEMSEWVATSYNNIGTVYNYQGDYPKALDYYNRALVILEKLLGMEHPDIALFYNNIGTVYNHQGDYPKALEYYNKALVIRERVLGTEHPNVATSYNNIGTVYNYQGDYPKALDYYNKALVILEKLLGMEHPDIALSYNNIGTVYNYLGDYPKALEYYNKALAIREKVLGTEHPDVAISYNNIALVYSNLGNYPKALDYYNKALAILEKVLGMEHPIVATFFNNIGGVYYNLGDYRKALEYYKKALAIREKVLGTEHPDVAQSFNNIGLIYDNQGAYPKALEYYNKALAIHLKVLGQEHPDVALSYSNIGYVYACQGDYPKALDYFLKALPIFKNALGKEHPNTIMMRENVEYVKKKISQSPEQVIKRIIRAYEQRKKGKQQ